jgi:hypothetical protein
VAFVAGEGGRQSIVLDGAEVAGYGPDWIVSWPPCFSEAGSVVAWRLTSSKSRGECIGVDGRRGEEFERVGPPVLSRDGRRVAYRAHRGDRCFVVVDGERGPDCELMGDPAMSADGKVVAYGARRAGRWELVVGGSRTPIEHQPQFVFLSPDGRSAGYWHFESPGGGASRVRVVVNGESGGAFTLVGSPVFSPDGKRVAYAADEGGRQYIVVGDRRVEVFGRESDPVFSRDGLKVGYGTRIGLEIWWKVLDVR